MGAVFNHKNSYTVPRWCRMPISDHFDGMGGCWGVSQGCVEEQGRDYCRNCGFHRRINERIDAFDAIGQQMDSAESQRQKVFRGEVETKG